ncbi:uncharacterized protein LOC100898959 [Galendromus occidentalis]|uniref:Uncharacterized protein LOC100898959 n=1 Tax=Galendromus occidentalis TaxID=34638 RepID=A0AAJ7P9T5_9ACAR|nr:uncharacterized protein LOC100898959 [Galendromus occidentalis]
MNSSTMLRTCGLIAFVAIVFLACSADAEPAGGLQDIRAFYGFQAPKDERMNNIIEALIQGGLGRGRNSYAEPMAPSKRQLRYHQCYFNPVSCFKRK